MVAMILRLDPSRPIVWRSPFSLQIGVDPVAAILERVDDGDARLIATLSTGATRPALERTAAAAAVTPERLDELLRLLAPALLPESTSSTPERPWTVAVRGSAPGRDRVARILAEAGCTIATEPAPRRRAAESIDAAILISHHVVDPIEHLAWLRRDIVHVPVILGERAVTVGPLVLPGESPCLACLEQQRADVDPAWPAIGSQLWGRPAAMDTPLATTLASLEVLTLLRDLAAGRGTPGTSIRIDLIDDARSVARWSASQRCGCRGLELTALAPVPA